LVEHQGQILQLILKYLMILERYLPQQKFRKKEVTKREDFHLMLMGVGVKFVVEMV
jgi:hypothetical protein